MSNRRVKQELDPICLNLSANRFNAIQSSLCVLFQTQILKWLLKHNPAERPAARELAQSDLLPVQEAELNLALQSAIAKPGGRTYRRILDELFGQPMPAPKSFLYDEDQHKVSSCNVGYLYEFCLLRSMIELLPVISSEIKIYYNILIQIQSCLLNQFFRAASMPRNSL